MLSLLEATFFYELVCRLVIGMDRFASRNGVEASREGKLSFIQGLVQ